MKIILASHNHGKIREFTHYLAKFEVNLVLQSELGITEVDETGLSFVENAIIKARHAASNSGLPAIADDSGLVVPYLAGRPGIYSARYAGANADAQANIDKLLFDLKDVPDEQRAAFFYCCIVFMSDANDPTPLICVGKWTGKILRESIGQQGFGYDPIFYVPSENKAAAQLPLVLKNQISHRGIALQLLLQQLPGKLCTLYPSKI